MPLIDNRTQTMHEALINALGSTDRVDVEVGFFYFSGWKLLAPHLKDKKIRILVGKYIDPNAIPDLLSRIKQEGENVDLEPYQPRQRIPSRIGKRDNYISSFTRLGNESSIFDDEESQEAFKLLEEKIENGSLEIKLTENQEHGKMYILHNKTEFNQGGDLPGTVFMGSSNLTFQGLLNQGELNERHNDKEHYQLYVSKFEELWKDSENIDIVTPEQKSSFVEILKKELWIHSVPLPFHVYVRVLHELFSRENEKDIKTPSQITNERYSDLEYQLDAIRATIEKLDKYNGVIVADVVGLGKSIIASAAAYNIGLTPIIIVPPHLKQLWETYQHEFRLPGARVFSSGGIKEVFDLYRESREPLLIIIDEAHRYRNEDTDDYRRLHHVCNSNPGNKVILLTATPFNNNPKDVFALIKLFQVPGQSTIRSVDNLSLRFRELIERYKKLNTYRRQIKPDQEHINNEADEISKELRRLIENIVIRRSRLDLDYITRYREDLERQNIQFAAVIGPELISYNLGQLHDLYINTLKSITGDSDGIKFEGARYKPVAYVKKERREEFMNRYKDQLEETDIATAQTNLSKFMRRLLVMRFESSREAFKHTLKKMIISNEVVQKWWNDLGKVPIYKKGTIPDPEDILQSTNDEVDDEVDTKFAENELEKLREAKGIVSIDSSFIDDSFITHLNSDISLLKNIYSQWYGDNAIVSMDIDPKLDEVKNKVDQMLLENSYRKIIIFSAYADTVNYLYEELKKRGIERILKYTSHESSRSYKEIVTKNFDAGISDELMSNDYDVLVATDALSEGFNLHRAGVVINYDIPYNPTRVIQRIGRINRINKKVFENLYIYNCFPTETGESEIRIREISTLKIKLINEVVGSDVKTLTSDEELKSFFKDEYSKADVVNNEISWETTFKEDYEQALKNKDVISAALKIKPRSRLIRKNQSENVAVAFGKKGNHSIFAVQNTGEPKIVVSEDALKYFRALPEENGEAADQKYNDTFKLVRDTLFAKNPLPPIRGRRADALAKIEILEQKVAEARDYCRDLDKIIRRYDGINDGDLKNIAQLKIKDGNEIEIFETMRNIVPEHQIASILEKVSSLESEYETIVLSEELRT